MNKQLIKNFNNEDLLKEICEAYDCELEITEDKIICRTEDNEIYKYNNIEEALVDWLDTLTESEMCYIEAKSDITWLPEINYITDIRTNLLFDNNIDLSKFLTYGEIPKHLYKKLSVSIDKQEKCVDNYMKNKTQDSQALKVSLPVEFVLSKNELRYIKIANEEFLKRLIIHNDTSEIGFLEQSIYVKNEYITKSIFAPLLASNKSAKFEINVPIAISIDSNNNLKIKTPINYVELF